MWRSRQRKRKGLRLLRLEVRENEVTALVKKGYLRPDRHGDRQAVVLAFYKFLDATLM
jgi:hypothetical protein